MTLVFNHLILLDFLLTVPFLVFQQGYMYGCISNLPNNNSTLLQFIKCPLSVDLNDTVIRQL